MNPIWGHLSGFVTVILLLTFIGIWIWVWSARHRRKYDALARLPMEDKTEQDSDPADEEKRP